MARGDASRQIRSTMKFLILAALVAVTAAEAYRGGYRGRGGYSRGGYGGYGRRGGYGKREADAEPGYGGYGGYGGYRGGRGGYGRGYYGKRSADAEPKAEAGVVVAGPSGTIATAYTAPVAFAGHALTTAYTGHALAAPSVYGLGYAAGLPYA